MREVYDALSDCRNREMSSGEQKNLVLSALSPRAIELITPHLKPVRLVQGEILEKQFCETSAVRFIESGVVSLVAVSLEGSQVEAGLIGREA